MGYTGVLISQYKWLSIGQVQVQVKVQVQVQVQ